MDRQRRVCRSHRARRAEERRSGHPLFHRLRLRRRRARLPARNAADESGLGLWRQQARRRGAARAERRAARHPPHQLGLRARGQEFRPHHPAAREGARKPHRRRRPDRSPNARRPDRRGDRQDRRRSRSSASTTSRPPARPAGTATPGISSPRRSPPGRTSSLRPRRSRLSRRANIPPRRRARPIRGSIPRSSAPRTTSRCRLGKRASGS